MMNNPRDLWSIYRLQQLDSFTVYPGLISESFIRNSVNFNDLRRDYSIIARVQNANMKPVCYLNDVNWSESTIQFCEYA